MNKHIAGIAVVVVVFGNFMAFMTDIIKSEIVTFYSLAITGLIQYNCFENRIQHFNMDFNNCFLVIPINNTLSL